MSFRLALHESILDQLAEFAASHPDSSSSLQTQLMKVAADPFNAGSPMRRLANPSLAGRVYKIWVKGRRGHRLAYFVDMEENVVCPFFVSMDPRADFDWDSVDWQSSIDPIRNDLLAGNEEAFSIFDPHRR